MLLFQSSPRFEAVERLSELRPDIKLNLLDSFGLPYNQSVMLRKIKRNIFLNFARDSGAYTINHALNPAVRELKASDYAKNLSVVGKYYDIVFNFDSDFSEIGFEENYKMQLEIESYGHCVVPVVHDLYGDELDFYVGRGHKLIALGSSQTRRPEDVKVAVMKCYPDVRIHLFGKVGFEYLAYMPIWSCDASSWAQYVKYGYVMFWDESLPCANKGVALGFNDRNGALKKKILVESYVNRMSVFEYLDKSLGLSYEDLVGDDAEINRQVVNMLYFYELEKRIAEIHEGRGWSFEV